MTTPCRIELTWHDDDVRQIDVAVVDGATYSASSSIDFEDAIDQLRSALEGDGLLLMCNRFRVNAFVSSMARQMSDGLGCYLVTKKVPVSPDQLVSSLEPAPANEVATRTTNGAFIDQWIESCRPRFPRLRFGRSH